ncbi:MAG: L-2-amino-thiazoline-4-carboxylic acid hydrolase, partial [Treponema sp.]|nr:L-2-amino-thiazoline-4-carboxylic acid hydrolase [Treponema sp.]
NRALTGLQNASEQNVMAEPAAGRRGNCRLLKKKLFPPAGRAIFEMEFLKLSDDVFDVDFHYCPLVSAWQKQGCSDKEIDQLCDWAMEGDRGIAEAFGCELELKKTIAKGDELCQIRFRRKL